MAHPGFRVQPCTAEVWGTGQRGSGYKIYLADKG